MTILHRTRLVALADVRLRLVPLLFTALFVQIAITAVFTDWNDTLLRVLHLGSYVLLGVFLWANRRITGIPLVANSARADSTCCRASGAVGARSAQGNPASATASRAQSATAVLPEPTSPCSRRCIGRRRPRSSRIVSSAAR